MEKATRARRSSHEKRIGVLTGGGDCPGLNPAIKGIVYSANEHRIEVIGFKDGYKGLIDLDFRILDRKDNDVRVMDRKGGTILGSTRTKPSKSEKSLEKALANFEKLGLDALICIGGEDTLGEASRFYKEHNIPTIGIPKTIDKDLSATEYTLGFNTAIDCIVQSINKLRTTGGSHSRILCVETMGRHAGWLALVGGLAGGAYVTLIPEVDFSMKRVAQLIAERRKTGVRYSIVVAAEGAKPLNEEGELDSFTEFAENLKRACKKKGTDEYGHYRLGGIVGPYIAMRIGEETGLETRDCILGHLQRGGDPTPKDRVMGLQFGWASVDAFRDKCFGTMVSANGRELVLVPLEDAVGSYKLVDVERYDEKNYRIKQKRALNKPYLYC